VADLFKTPQTEKLRENVTLEIPDPGKTRLCWNASLPSENNLKEDINNNNI
jgi:hypothetical protein